MSQLSALSMIFSAAKLVNLNQHQKYYTVGSNLQEKILLASCNYVVEYLTETYVDTLGRDALKSNCLVCQIGTIDYRIEDCAQPSAFTIVKTDLGAFPFMLFTMKICRYRLQGWPPTDYIDFVTIFDDDFGVWYDSVATIQLTNDERKRCSSAILCAKTICPDESSTLCVEHAVLQTEKIEGWPNWEQYEPDVSAEQMKELLDYSLQELVDEFNV